MSLIQCSVVGGTLAEFGAQFVYGTYDEPSVQLCVCDTGAEFSAQ